jgi:hypothetical protein
VSDRDALAGIWIYIADSSCRGYSPLYDRICRAVAESDAVLEMVAEAPPVGPPPRQLDRLADVTCAEDPIPPCPLPALGCRIWHEDLGADRRVPSRKRGPQGRHVSRRDLEPQVRTGGHEVPSGRNETAAEPAVSGVGLDLVGRLPAGSQPPADGHQAGTVGGLPHAQFLAVAAGPLDARMIRWLHLDELDELDGRIAVGPGRDQDNVEAPGPASNA